ncbi:MULTISPECIES: transposase [unclassified Streptomyces]|uniref:IS110 family transposase n=1 Tax=unclassified Streptomyces TaxID=2593676 RepID=UPI002F916E85
MGIETDHGSWAQALIGSGCQVYAINLRQASGRGTARPGARSDKGDAHALADMVRIDRVQLRPVAGDSERAQAVKVVARARQTLIWERTRTFLRLWTMLREYFPAALSVYADLELPPALEGASSQSQLGAPSQVVNASWSPLWTCSVGSSGAAAHAT